MAAVYTNSSNATTGNGEGIGYLRVYEGIDGSQSIKTQVNGWTKLSAKLNTSNKKLTAEDQKKTYTVDDSWLADEKSYKGNNLATGGLYLRERTDDRFFDTTNRGKDAQNAITTFPLLRGQHHNYILFADEWPGSIKEKPTSNYQSVMKPYLFWVYGTVDGVPYGGGGSIRSGYEEQDGILLPKAAKAASGATGISLMSTDAEIAVEPDTLTRYASGIDRLNIDIPEEICGLGLSWKIENADGDITASGDIDDLKASGSTGGPRSLSIRYDYNTYLTLSLMDGEEVYETYAIDPATQARTLTSSGGDQYYIRKDGVVSVAKLAEALKNQDAEKAGDYAADALAAEGTFVHVYGSEALGADGRIVDLTTGEATGSVDSAAVGTVSLDAQAAYTTYTGSGSVLELYSDYSLATTEGLTAARQFRMFSKKGQTFAVDVDTAKEDGAGLHDLVADIYENGQSKYQYLSYLTADGSVKDLNDRLHWPKELSNNGLGEIAGNITGTEPILLVRYEDNTVAAFQYLTGTLIAKDSGEQKKLNFIRYANIWLADLKSSFRKADNTAYLAAVKMADGLLEEPIDTELALNVTGKAENFSTELQEGKTANRVTAGNNLLAGALNAAAANWKDEALNAKGEKGQGFLDTAQTILEDSVRELAVSYDKDSSKGSDSTTVEPDAAVATEKAADEIAIDSGNAAAIKSTLRSALEQPETKAKLISELTAQGIDAKEAEKLLSEYSTEVRKAVDEAAARQLETPDIVKAAEAADAETEDTEGMAEADGTGKGSGDKKELPTDGYVIAMNSETGEYEVYSEQDLLDGKKPQASLISENQKLTALKSAGLLKNTGIDLEALKVTAEENSQGILLLACAGGAVLILLLVMYRKRKKMG